MATALFLATLAAACLTGLGLRVRGAHWFRAWFWASLVIPAVLVITEFFDPSGWLGVALFFGTLYGFGMATLGVFIGWLITRKRSGDAAA
jgi:hypothetical protein